MESGRARVVALLLALLAAPLLALPPPPALAAGPTHDPALFEAAFQGRCGAGSPCAQLCRELHDGTYECGCKPGFLLNVDGYSCQELNSTSRPLDASPDTAEDVLYQKDASFSAELDLALLPKSNRVKATSIDDADFYKLIEDNHIYNQRHIDRQTKTTLLPNYISNLQDFKEYNYTYSGERYKQMKGLNNLIAEGISRKDINMITDEKTRLDEDSYTSEDVVRKGEVTTLGPSLDQKVPGVTSSPRWTAAVSPGAEESGGAAERCGGTAGRCLCPLGRGGPLCQQETRITSPRFSGGGWLALPALRGAYKRVRMRLRVRPERARGVLLLTGERDDLSGDYLALLLRDGHVELRFDCGSGAGVLRSPEPVRLARWNTIYVYRHRWDARLRLNSGQRLRGRSKGLFSRMTFREPVWVGGAGNTSGLDSKLSLSDGLVGCVDFLRINSKTYHLVRDATAGADVSECAPSAPWQTKDIVSTSEVPKTSFSHNNITFNDRPIHSHTNVTFSDHMNLVPIDHIDHSMPSDFGNLRYADSAVIMRDSTRDTNNPRNEEISDKFKISDEKSGVENYDNSISDRFKNSVDKSDEESSDQSVRSNNVSDGNSDDVRSDEKSCSCVHGGACVRGVCLCPLGYAGDSCQITLDLKVPRFNGSSYLRLPGLGSTALSWLHIELTLKATSGTGLVLYDADRASGAGDFFSLQLRDYFVEFAFDLGSGIALVRSASPLLPDVWHRVSVSRSGKRAQLRVWLASSASGASGSATRSVTSAGHSGQLSLRQPLLLGGAPHPLPSRLALSSSFSGCIKQLIINEEELSVVSSALGGVNVDNCEDPTYNLSCSPTEDCKGSLEVSPEPTQNFSSDAIHHSIVPKKGFRIKHHKAKQTKKVHPHSDRYRMKKYMKLKKSQYHRSMERSNDIVTDGPNEPNFKNLYNDETYMQVKYMDTNEINWSDTNSYPSFAGKDSFIHIDDSETMKRLLSYTLDINIRFKSVSSNGLLVWSGRNNMAPGDDFLALAVENSMLVFRYDLGSGEVVIVANHTVDDGLWHRARATRNRQAGVLEVDGLGSVGKVSPGKLKQLNTENGLYIGGLPSIASNTLGKYTGGIKGCISQISLSGDFDIPLSLNKLPHTITNNVGRCLP